MEYRRNINDNKRKKGLLERFLEYSKLNEDDDDELFDEDLKEYYSRNKEIRKNQKEPEWFNAFLNYDDDEKLINKLLIGEMLNFEDLEILMKRTIKEFKRTFSAPNKNIEVVFREFKGENFGDVINGIFNDNEKKKEVKDLIDTKDEDIKSKDGGDEDEKEKD